jgi:hypothetical protein
MARLSLLARLPFDEDGKPDLGLGDQAEIVVEGAFFHVYRVGHRGCALSMRWLGSQGDDEWFSCFGTRKALRRLAHIASKVERLSEAWMTPAKRDWLMEHGVEEKDGKPIAPHTLSGDNPVAVGKNEDA